MAPKKKTGLVTLADLNKCGTCGKKPTPRKGFTTLDDIGPSNSGITKSTARKSAKKTGLHTLKDVDDGKLPKYIEKMIDDQTFDYDSSDEDEISDEYDTDDADDAGDADYNESDDQDSDGSAGFESETEEDPENRNLTEEEFEKAKADNFLSPYAKERGARRHQEIIVYTADNGMAYRKMNDEELLQSGTVIANENGGTYGLIADSEGAIIKTGKGIYHDCVSGEDFAVVDDGEGGNGVTIKLTTVRFVHREDE